MACTSLLEMLFANHKTNYATSTSNTSSIEGHIDDLVPAQKIQPWGLENIVVQIKRDLQEACFNKRGKGGGCELHRCMISNLPKHLNNYRFLKTRVDKCLDPSHRVLLHFGLHNSHFTAGFTGAVAFMTAI